MTRRGSCRIGALVWAVLGAAVALNSLGDVNDDARLLIGVASVVGPLLAAWAAPQLSRRADRSAGLLLVASAVLTPTYFAYAFNLPALVVGLVLAVAPQTLLPQADEGSGHPSPQERAG